MHSLTIIFVRCNAASSSTHEPQSVLGQLKEKSSNPWEEVTTQGQPGEAHHVISKRLAQEFCHSTLEIGTANSRTCEVEKVQSNSQLVHVLPQLCKLLELLPSHLVADMLSVLTDASTCQLE